MADNNLSQFNTDVVFTAPYAVVLKNKTTGQQQLNATIKFNSGDLISPFYAGETHSTPNYLTVQVGEHTHITLQPSHLQYINHSCKPNAFFNTDTMELIALDTIEAGEEITFFYPSTEWKMDQPFVCQCGKPECLQLIQGAAYLSNEILQHYRLTNFIQEQILQKV